MKTLLVLAGLVTYSVAGAACHNFSGNYLHRDSNRPLDVEQTKCESIIMDYLSGDREPLILDNKKRKTYEDSSVTSYLTAKLEGVDVVYLKYEKHYSRPAGRETTEVRLRPGSWNGRQLLVKESGFYVNGRMVSKWDDVYIKQ